MMRKNDWNKFGTEHLERLGCIINIREKVRTLEEGEITSIEMTPKDGWVQEDYSGIRVFKKRK